MLRVASGIGRMLAIVSLLALAPAAAAAPLAGLPLEDAIAVLESAGLRVLYSTDLVKPWMRVRSEPAAADPVAVLNGILAPYGLTTAPGANETVLVVRAAPPAARRAARDTPAAPVARSGADRPAGGRRPALEEVIVATSRYPLERATGSSPFVLSATDIAALPDLGDDALRPIARLPGAAANGLSARPHFRGGEIGETLVRIDGLRLYDPFHLKDFQSLFSAVDPRVVDSIDVYTGGFPARFGDRMSGVIDVATMHAPDERYHEVGVSFFNASLLSAGTIDDGRGEWVFSARRGNLDLLYNAFSDQPDRPRYLDIFGKFSYGLGERLRITGSVLQSRDDISLADDIDREERASADHDDFYGWLRFDHDLGAGLRGSTIVARTTLDGSRSGRSDKAGVSSGALSDSRSFAIESLSSEWRALLGEDMTLTFGGGVAHMAGRYDYADSVDFVLLFGIDGTPGTPSRTRSLAVGVDGRRYELHATVRRSLTPHLTADVGLRWDRQTLSPDDRGTLAPRFGLRFEIGPRTELKASLGRFHQSQAVNELPVSDGETVFSRPQRSDHLVLGIEHYFSNGLGLRAEAYRKRMSHLRPRYENLLNDRVLLPELKPDRIRIAPDGATARGLEVMLDGRSGALAWWVALAWSEVEDLLGDARVPRAWDQPRTLRGGVTFDSERWSFGLAGGVHSGWPTTPIALAADGDPQLIAVGERASLRFGGRASLDLLVSRTLAFKRSSLTVSFELTNALNRSNTCCLEYEIGEDEEAGMLLLKELSYLGRVPSIGFLWKF